MDSAVAVRRLCGVALALGKLETTGLEKREEKEEEKKESDTDTEGRMHEPCCRVARRSRRVLVIGDQNCKYSINPESTSSFIYLFD